LGCCQHSSIEHSFTLARRSSRARAFCYEAVSFDNTRITSGDWSSYPILRFPEVPQAVEVYVIDRPGQPFLGTGEAAHEPTAAAIANAVADATGARIRELPLTHDRVKAAIGI
jgi:nicotinate dehydrogenase subunit B